jgi:hypothetical protein
MRELPIEITGFAHIKHIARVFQDFLRRRFFLKITIDGKSRTVTPEEFINSCERHGVSIKGGRLHGSSSVVAKFQRLLDASPELEEAVLVELAKANGELEDLYERQAILWADDLPCSLVDATRALAER